MASVRQYITLPWVTILGFMPKGLFSRGTNWLNTNRPRFAAASKESHGVDAPDLMGRLVAVQFSSCAVEKNLGPPYSRDATVLSSWVCWCELNSRRLLTAADWKSEVWTCLEWIFEDRWVSPLTVATRPELATGWPRFHLCSQFGVIQ